MSARTIHTNRAGFFCFMANLIFGGRFGGPEQLISSAQTLTGSWVNLGNELSVKGSRLIGLWSLLTVNDSLNVQARILIRHTSGGDDYVLPTKSMMPAQDTDEMVTWELDALIPFVQFQVKAGTVGGTAGQVTAADVTVGL